MIKEIMEQLQKLRGVYEEMESANLEEVYKCYERIDDELRQLESDLEDLKDTLGG